MSRKSTVKSVKPAAVAFDKYDFYRRAVQSPEVDVRFIRDTYRELKNKEPQDLREDFCGTFAISCEWAKLSPKYRAFGIDLDHEPISYGMTHNLTELSKTQSDRVIIREENVLSPGLPKVDVIAAMNFSHYIFKTRETMKQYFANAYSTLNDGGLMVADCFGGPACQKSNKDSTKHRGFTYIWEQVGFDPVTSEAVFHIHFKVNEKAGKVRHHKHQFTYDWRMWSILELREIMIEAGFKKTHVYWEGTSRKGDGNGIFTRVDSGEICEAWVAYVVGEK
ncbi:hypothetical protein BH10BDE1_BH10BDE1_30730 [soil metagenome]